MSAEELLERLLTELPRRIVEELRSSEPAVPLTITAAARRLRIRRARLEEAVQAGWVATAPWKGKHPRIPPDEVERLRREGLQDPRAKRRRRKVAQASVAAKIMQLKL